MATERPSPYLQVERWETFPVGVWRWPAQEGQVPVFALHGFTGCGRDFQICIDHGVPGNWTAVDLPGHAESGLLPVTSFLEFLARLCRNSPEPPVLLGYSMGGRVALQIAARLSAHLGGLVLIGASAGLKARAERVIRAEEDRRRAASIMSKGVAAFVEAWQQHPLIRSQQNTPSPWRQQILVSKGRHTAEGLAFAVEAFSPGILPSVHNSLSAIDCPTLLLAGEQDAKYRTIGRHMADALPAAQFQAITGAGHACHFEAPNACCEAISSFLRSLS